MANDRTLAELVKAPEDPEDMTVDLLLRIIGCETQREYLQNWADLEKNGKEQFLSPVYMARTQALISGVGLMFCLRTLRKIDPAAADEFVRHYWNMCDAGDSFGELLWQFTEEAGLNPELVKLEPVGAVTK